MTGCSFVRIVSGYLWIRRHSGLRPSNNWGLLGFAFLIVRFLRFFIESLLEQCTEATGGVPWQNAFTCHKSPRFESTACSTKLRTQGKVATIASYRVSHVLAQYKKPFKDGDNVKEVFLKAADNLFLKTSKIKHRSRGHQRSATLPQCYYKAMWGNGCGCGGATKEGYWRLWVLFPPIWRVDWYGGRGTIVCFHQDYFLKTWPPRKSYSPFCH